MATLAVLVGLGGCDLFERPGGPLAAPEAPQAAESRVAFEPVQLAWTPVERATGYEVWLARDFQGERDITSFRVAEARVDSAFALGHYTWRVRALEGYEWGYWSDAASFTLDQVRVHVAEPFTWEQPTTSPGTWHVVGSGIPGVYRGFGFDRELEEQGVDPERTSGWRLWTASVTMEAPVGHTLADFAGVRFELGEFDAEVEGFTWRPACAMLGSPDDTVASLAIIEDGAVLRRRSLTERVAVKTSTATVAGVEYRMLVEVGVEMSVDIVAPDY